jgi:hypothetical protein
MSLRNPSFVRMKYIHRLLSARVVLPLVLGGAFCSAHAQSVSNGDLSKGNTGWKGDRVVQADPAKADNKVLGIELSKFSYKYFSQQVEAGGGQTITLSFDFNVSLDYAGDGFRIQVSGGNRAPYYQDYTQASDSWTHAEFKYSDVNGARKLDISFRVNPGLGKIYFDNFKLTK